MIAYLKTHDKPQMDAALKSSGLIDAEGQYQQGIDIITVGLISQDTGQLDENDEPIYTTLPGWHVNIYGALTPEQLADLPTIPAPGTPHVVLWT